MEQLCCAVSLGQPTRYLGSPAGAVRPGAPPVGQEVTGPAEDPQIVEAVVVAVAVDVMQFEPAGPAARLTAPAAGVQDAPPQRPVLPREVPSFVRARHHAT